MVLHNKVQSDFSQGLKGSRSVDLTEPGSLHVQH
jgi:hypothetical protein